MEENLEARTKLLLDSGFRFHLQEIRRYENSFFNDPSVDWFWLCGLANRLK